MSMNGKEMKIDCPFEDYPIKFSACRAEELEDIINYLGSSSCLRAGEDASFQGERGCVTKGRVDLCKAGLGVEGLESVLKVFQSKVNLSLNSLLLGTNGLGDKGMVNVSQYLKEGLVLETLYLGCNSISEAGVKILTNALVENSSIQALWLKRNRIGDEGVGHIASLLDRRDLRTLDLVNTGISFYGLEKLVSSIIHNQSAIENLYLGGNGFTSEHAPLLVKLIKESQVKRLYLGVSQLGDKGGAILFDAINEGSNLELLCVRSNGFSDKIGPSLKYLQHSNLRYLYFGKLKSEQKLGSKRNQLEKSALMLRESIDKLNILDLSSNTIDHRTANGLIEAYESSSSLRYLNLGSNALLRVQKRKLGSINELNKKYYTSPNADAEKIISEGRLLT